LKFSNSIPVKSILRFINYRLYWHPAHNYVFKGDGALCSVYFNVDKTYISFPFGCNQ